MQTKIFYFLLFLFFLAGKEAFAQGSVTLPEGSLLQDFNADGRLTVVAFGDSITRGEGDFIEANSKVESTPRQTRPAGYALRIETYLGIDVRNLGNSGESLTSEETIERFISIISGIRPDVIIIAEGINDGRYGVTSGLFYRRLQTMINIAKAAGAVPIVTTIFQTTGAHAFLNGAISAYNTEIRVLAIVNNLELADANHAFINTCTYPECHLLNRPEGLHPNIEGYDVLGEVMTSTLLKINLFAADGPTLLSQALGIPVTDINTIPDPVVP